MDNNVFQDTIIFPEICYTSPGEYTYVIRETSTSGEGWHGDNREYKVIVTVAANWDGQLSANISYPDGFPEFVNYYEEPCQCKPKTCRCDNVCCDKNNPCFNHGYFYHYYYCKCCDYCYYCEHCKRFHCREISRKICRHI